MHFFQNTTQATINIQIVNDTTPELAETYTCLLNNPQNGVAISSYDNASITISPSDKPHGVISVDSASKQLVVTEPTRGHDGSFSVR